MGIPALAFQHELFLRDQPDLARDMLQEYGSVRGTNHVKRRQNALESLGASQGHRYPKDPPTGTQPPAASVSGRRQASSVMTTNKEEHQLTMSKILEKAQLAKERQEWFQQRQKERL